MSTIRTFSFPADHPAAAGHFPGRPLAPAALILSEVLAGVTDLYARSVATIQSAKFMSALTPGEHCEIELRPTPDDRQLEFLCRVGTRPVAKGCLQLAPADPPPLP